MISVRVYRYEVTGFGDFPTDMLRYDNAKVVSSRPHPTVDKRLIYTLEGSFPPTVGRWKSFMWSVKHLD